MSKSDERKRSSPTIAMPRGGASRRDLLLGGSALAAATAAGSLATPAAAQNSPIGGQEILPVPDPPFGGVIGRKANESKPDFPKA